MSPAPTPAPAPPRPNRFERLTRAYEDEIYPVFDHWFTEPLVAALNDFGISKSEWKSSHVLDLGAGAGHVSAALASHKPATLVSVDASGAMLNLLYENDPSAGSATLVRAGGPGAGLPFASNSFDLVVGRARADAGADPWASRHELRRVCRGGGRLAISAALQGTWVEPLELLDETLQRRNDQTARQALSAYQSKFPSAEALAAQLQSEGWSQAKVNVTHKQVLFRSGREFFFSPLIELGPLRAWKALVGKGEPLQAAFAGVKDAIDTYYAGRPFAVTVGIATITATKPKHT